MNELRGFGLEPEGKIQISQSLVKAVERAVEIGAGQIRPVIIRIGLNGRVEIIQSLIIATRLPQRQTAIGIGFGKIRIERDGLREIGNRLFELRGPREGCAAGIEGHGITRIVFHHLIEGIDIGRCHSGVVGLDFRNIGIAGGAASAQRCQIDAGTKGQRQRQQKQKAGLAKQAVRHGITLYRRSGHGMCMGTGIQGWQTTILALIWPAKRQGLF